VKPDVEVGLFTAQTVPILALAFEAAIRDAVGGTNGAPDKEPTLPEAERAPVDLEIAALRSALLTGVYQGGSDAGEGRGIVGGSLGVGQAQGRCREAEGGVAVHHPQGGCVEGVRGPLLELRKAVGGPAGSKGCWGSPS